MDQLRFLNDCVDQYTQFDEAALDEMSSASSAAKTVLTITTISSVLTLLLFVNLFCFCGSFMLSDREDDDYSLA